MKRKILLVLILVIAIFACMFGLSACNSPNGTYYKLKANGEPDPKTYFILKSGKWEDEDGESGTYKKDGENITFFVTFFGETEELTTGTLKDYVLKVGKDTYISEKHKHNYGEWEGTEATCTEDGIKTRSCACGMNEREVTKMLSHNFGDWEYDCTNHWKTCSLCNSKIELNIHSGTNCNICNFLLPWFRLNDARNGYILYGIHKSVKKLNIPSTYKDLPITSIGERAFADTSLTSITIPDSVTSIGNSAFAYTSLTGITIPDSITSIGKDLFYDCSSLTNISIPDSVNSIGQSAFHGCTSLMLINFAGTKAQWKAITKVGNWNFNTGNYNIYCSDGKIKKADS